MLRGSSLNFSPAFARLQVHESSADVLVRVRQLLSITETQYQSDNIVIVSPDSDNLTVLQAAVAGLDLRAHHRHAWAPGEVRRLFVSSAEPETPPTSVACPRPPQCL
jgi:broad specificity phosphatase PhoE